MTSRSRRNPRITPSNIPRRRFSSLLGAGAIAALSFAPLVPAESPPASQKPAGAAALLDSLKSRSAVERWDEMEKFHGPESPKVLPNPPHRGGEIPSPARSDQSKVAPFPQPKRVGDESPRTAPAARSRQGNALQPRLPSFREPVFHLDAAAAQDPAPRKPDRAVILRPLKGISPFPDYQPPEYIPTRKSKVPAQEPVPTWETTTFQRRAGENILRTWEASNLSHNPLYFENVPLERYGHTYPEVVQPFASIALFSAQLLGLPYQTAIDPVCKEIYTLGYYRPGEACVPKLFYRVPWNAEAAGVEAGVATGLFFLIP